MNRPLRIFLCCQQSAQRHAVPAYGFWAGYLRHGLQEAGHSCLEAAGCDWAGGLPPLEAGAAKAWRERTWDTALDFLRREHARAPVDFFLGYLFPRQVAPAALAEIRALGIPCVNFFCDNVREFLRVPEEFRGFDLHWVPEHKALPLYQEAELPHLHAPMPCWVPPDQRHPVEAETLPVTFVGTRDPLRERLFADAIALGLEVELRGVGWDGTVPVAPAPPRARNPLTLVRRQVDFARQHGWGALVRKAIGGAPAAGGAAADLARRGRAAPGEQDYWTALREAVVCLGVNRYPSWRYPADRPDTYSRLRDIEAPMAGACYLTEWTEGLEKLYDLGAEIESYRDAGELAGKTKSLLADPARRKRMRRAAQQRALAEHSIARSLQRIAARLNLPR